MQASVNLRFYPLLCRFASARDLDPRPSDDFHLSEKSHCPGNEAGVVIYIIWFLANFMAIEYPAFWFIILGG